MTACAYERESNQFCIQFSPLQTNCHPTFLLRWLRRSNLSFLWVANIKEVFHVCSTQIFILSRRTQWEFRAFSFNATIYQWKYKPGMVECQTLYGAEDIAISYKQTHLSWEVSFFIWNRYVLRFVWTDHTWFWRSLAKRTESSFGYLSRH